MANQEQLRLLQQGVPAWNQWRRENGEMLVDLRMADLREANLRGADLGRANLDGAYLKHADLSEASLDHAILRGVTLTEASLTKASLACADLTQAVLCQADLREADLGLANLFEADLTGALLRRADFYGASCFETHFYQADLREADFSTADCRFAHFAHADVRGADFTDARVNDANFEHAQLTHCRIDRLVAWNACLTHAEQRDLVLQAAAHVTLTIDTLPAAQTVSFLLSTDPAQPVFAPGPRKMVLLLGSFPEERQATLTALKDLLRTSEYLPLVCPWQADWTADDLKPLLTLAPIFCFVLFDLTDMPNLPHHLSAFLAQGKAIIQPLLEQTHQSSPDWSTVPVSQSILPLVHYRFPFPLTEEEGRAIIEPAERMQQHIKRYKL